MRAVLDRIPVIKNVYLSVHRFLEMRPFGSYKLSNLFNCSIPTNNIYHEYMYTKH